MTTDRRDFLKLATTGAVAAGVLGAVTATASFRFSKWLDQWFARSGCKIIVGKGGMSSADYRDKLVPNGAIYLTTVGYGTGALLGRTIKKVVAAHWLEELGIAQAMWVFEVEKFGPKSEDERIFPTTILGNELQCHVGKNTARTIHGRSEERRVGKECRSRWSPDH